ncbi:hypothetical protein Tco_0638054 [Tanacetum coccineum]
MPQRCKDAHLVLNWEKCHFMVKEGIVLGHKVSSAGLEVDKAKINVISKLPPPTNIKGVRSFLGHVGFYRRFIKEFSKIARPITKLLEKDTPFEFDDEFQKSIRILEGETHMCFCDQDVEPEPNLPLQEIIILDPDDQPMWESAKTVAPTPNSAIIQLDVDENLVINSTHLKMISENKFDGIQRADPHDHIREFLAICNMFRYGETQSEAIKLLIFPFSLCDKAKTWFNELNEESIIRGNK